MFITLCLIPMVQGADTIENFRPISLANFHFKIITKVLEDTLIIVASKIISQHQMGFIKCRQIGDCVCISSEVINMLQNMSFGGNLALKFHIRKTSDTIDWNFLLQALQAFGFDRKFYSWIDVILQSTKLSV